MFQIAHAKFVENSYTLIHMRTRLDKGSNCPVHKRLEGMVSMRILITGGAGYIGNQTLLNCLVNNTNSAFWIIIPTVLTLYINVSHN